MKLYLYMHENYANIHSDDTVFWSVYDLDRKVLRGLDSAWDL